MICPNLIFDDLAKVSSWNAFPSLRRSVSGTSSRCPSRGHPFPERDRALSWWLQPKKGCSDLGDGAVRSRASGICGVLTVLMDRQRGGQHSRLSRTFQLAIRRCSGCSSRADRRQEHHRQSLLLPSDPSSPVPLHNRRAAHRSRTTSAPDRQPARQFVVPRVVRFRIGSPEADRSPQYREVCFGLFHTGGECAAVP